MAENRGGLRPTAPQNNPANVSATGGAGQSGTQGAKYYSGLPYGQGQAMMAQQQAAPMAASRPAPIMNPIDSFPAPMPLSGPSELPDIPITDGAAMGAGAGMEALTMPQTQDNDVEKQRLLSYLPALEAAAQNPNSSQAFRNYVRILRVNLL